MKPLFAAFLLIFGMSDTFAFAKWLRMGADARAEIFIDINNIEKPAAHVKAWTLLTFKTTQRGGWLSERRLFLYSCKDQKLEWLQSQFYDDYLGDGQLLNVRTINKYGVSGLMLGELDPSTTKEKSNYKEAVPEANYLYVFKQFC